MSEKKPLTKKQRKEKARKLNKILLFSGLGITAVQVVVTVVFIVMLHFIDILPTDYKVLIDILLILLCAVTGITQRWKGPGIVTKVISVMLSIILVAGSIYINITYKAIDRMSGISTKTTSVGVYVLADNPAETVDDVAGDTFGILESLDRANTDDTLSEIEEHVGAEISVEEYSGYTELADALYDGTVQVILLNTGYVGVLTEIDGYTDFEERTKLLTSYDKEETVDTSEINEDYLYSTDGHVFAMYISGIDIEGSPTANRNSDVNIICVVNKTTHQVLLVNTPRDYYVATTVSGGALDKLTHAGCSGIDCSVGTLEMLYEVNIDYYLKVNFTGFKAIINALGGVDVYSEYAFTATHGGYSFQVGYNHMNGEQALGFARERYAFGSGDNQRGKNQMQVIKAVIGKLTSSDLLKNYTDVLNSISESMATNMTYDEISDFAKFQLSEMPTWDVMTYAVTGTGESNTCYSLGSKYVYVMRPDYDTVNQAISYITAMYNDEYISVQ